MKVHSLTLLSRVLRGELSSIAGSGQWVDTTTEESLMKTELPVGQRSSTETLSKQENTSEEKLLGP